MASEHAPTPNRAPCAAHGLFYDPRLASGCVLCLRERAQSEATVRSGGRSLALLLGALGLVLSALAVGAVRSGVLAPWLDRSGTDAVVVASETATGRASRPARGRPLRVLFVGNSLTSANDLPAMVEGLATAASASRPLEPQAVTFDGFTLRDHLAANAVATQLAHGGSWDVVVLQEQGQRPGWPKAREGEFFASARALDAAIRRAGARTVLYATMGRRDGDGGSFPGDSYDAMQQRIDEGYGQLARELRAELVPVGRAWRAMLRRRPELPLWQPDGLHPSTAGSYLAACAFYASFYRQSPVGNAYVAGLPAADALAIQSLAAEVVLQVGTSEATVAELATTPATPSPEPTTGAAADRDQARRETALREAREREAAQDRARHERITAELQAREAASERERRARMQGEIQAQEQRSGRRRVQVTMYKTAWCGACKRASAYMQREGIAVREHDVEHDREARAVYRLLNPRGGVPTIDVDGAVLVGWSEPRFEAMLAEALTRRAR